jgi:hypothetical protein
MRRVAIEAGSDETGVAVASVAAIEQWLLSRDFHEVLRELPDGTSTRREPLTRG